MNRYALVNSDGLTAVEHDTAGPGGTLIDGTYTPPDRQDGDG